MIAAIVAIAYLLSIRRRKKPVDVNVQPPADDIDDITLADGKGEELMDRICQLMDDEQLYLRSDLKLQDVAVRLSTNSSYVSECINSVRSQSFSLFINTYRIRHAQELLRKQPDIKTATLAEESGFSTETTFFRNFKIVTGMTPREWLTTLAQGQQ
jgi:YesN/AraC family two-component response regulator